jgi:hypothetical protein
MAVSKFSRWLSGSFTCMKCGREFNTMTFGYGEAICPDCFQGEQQFLFYDQTYWLNRLTAKLINHKQETPEPEPYDPHLMVQDYMPQIEA